MDDDFQDFLDRTQRRENQSRIRRNGLKDRLNPLEAFSEVEFYDRFRVNKDGFLSILELVEPELPSFAKKTNSPLNKVQQLSVALRFFASGDFQVSCGDFQGISQPTVCRTVHRITDALAKLSQQIISFPEDCSEVNTFFLEYCGLPAISGIIDGTQIPIISPGGENAELFRCRKGFFSYNVQVVCDHKLRIIDIVSGWPGSTHDSRVWNNSRLCTEFCMKEKQGLLLGDSGYPLEPFLMIPYEHPPNSRAKGRFNRALCRARCTVERCIGVFKRRWPCLSRKLRCSYRRVPNVIVACAVLHNLCIELNQPSVNIDDLGIDESEEDPDNPNRDMDSETEYRPGEDYIFRGKEVRTMLTERFDY